MADGSGKPSKVAIFVFEGADILDFNGPAEILTSICYDQEGKNNIFKAFVIGDQPTIRVGNAITINTDMTLDEATKQIQDFDVLVMPGARPDIIMNLLEQKPHIAKFIQDFASSNTDPAGQRIILSVCTGALFLAAAGVLKGKKATTHHMALDILRKLEPSANVVSHADGTGTGRYVDSGANSNGVRIITAGGVTCGLDASLFVGELKAGREVAEFTAKMLEHNWQRA